VRQLPTRSRVISAPVPAKGSAGVPAAAAVDLKKSRLFMAFLLFSDFADMAGAQSGTNSPDPFPLRAVDQTVF
jgi:hypothetical protein